MCPGRFTISISRIERRHESAAFDVKLIPGSADLKFQLLHNNRVINNEDDSIEVTWEEAAKRPAHDINDLETRI